MSEKDEPWLKVELMAVISTKEKVAVVYLKKEDKYCNTETEELYDIDELTDPKNIQHE